MAPVFLLEMWLLSVAVNHWNIRTPMAQQPADFAACNPAIEASITMASEGGTFIFRAALDQLMCEISLNTSIKRSGKGFPLFTSDELRTINRMQINLYLVISSNVLERFTCLRLHLIFS